MSHFMSWTDLIQIIGMGLLAFYQWMMSRSLANRQEIVKLSNEVGKLSTRIDLLEKDMQAAPTHRDLGELYNRINNISDSSSRMEGQVNGMADNVRLILARLTEKKDE